MQACTTPQFKSEAFPTRTFDLQLTFHVAGREETQTHDFEQCKHLKPGLKRLMLHPLDLTCNLQP